MRHGWLGVLSPLSIMHSHFCTNIAAALLHRGTVILPAAAYEQRPSAVLGQVPSLRVVGCCVNVWGIREAVLYSH